MNVPDWLTCSYVGVLLLFWKPAIILFRTFEKMDARGEMEAFQAGWLKLLRDGLWRGSLSTKLSVLVGLALGVFFSPVFFLVGLQLSIEETKSKEVFPMGILKAFGWFLRGEARDVVDLSRAELRRDLRAMRKEKRNFLYILLVVSWRTVATMTPIVWDGFVRVCYKLAPIAWLVRLLG